MITQNSVDNDILAMELAKQLDVSMTKASHILHNVGEAIDYLQLSDNVHWRMRNGMTKSITLLRWRAALVSGNSLVVFAYHNVLSVAMCIAWLEWKENER